MVFLYLNTKEYSHFKHLVNLNLMIVDSEQESSTATKSYQSPKFCLSNLSEDEFEILISKFTYELGTQTKIMN